VAKLLADLGAKHIDADKVAHEVFQPDSEGWRALVDAYGKEIVAPTGR
jgi:dephospho-CoA kinase